MKRHSPLDYAYAVARVRALENLLVGKSVFLDAASAPDTDSALAVLCGAGHFSEEFRILGSLDELDSALAHEEWALESLLSDLLIDKPVLEIFRNDGRPWEALETAAAFGSSFIADYLKQRIDLGNIKVFLRAGTLNLSEERLKESLHPGGFLAEKIFREKYGAPIADFEAVLQPTPYAELWRKAVAALREKETYIELERGIEDFLMERLMPAKTMTFGPEPVYAYGLAKRRELALARKVVSGKIHRIPDELLGERISATYV